jgi:hypothetical protein
MNPALATLVREDPSVAQMPPPLPAVQLGGDDPTATGSVMLTLVASSVIDEHPVMVVAVAPFGTQFAERPETVPEPPPEPPGLVICANTAVDKRAPRSKSRVIFMAISLVNVVPNDADQGAGC